MQIKSFFVDYKTLKYLQISSKNGARGVYIYYVIYKQNSIDLGAGANLAFASELPICVLGDHSGTGLM